jgi:hypothetical protein
VLRYGQASTGVAGFEKLHKNPVKNFFQKSSNNFAE